MTDPASPATTPGPAPGAVVRGLLRAADRATLATTLAGDAGPGWPYASLVLMAVDHDASPLLLVSTLAEHTRNLQADPRAAILVDGTAGLDEPLTGARATLLGRFARDDDPERRARYLRRHPSAAGYAGFGDFAIWRMTVERAHLVAGFGRIHWMAADAVLGEPGLPLAAREADVVAHMNEDHADAIQLYARVLLGLDGEGWRMTGCDAEGADLRLGGRVARLPFDQPVRDAEAARIQLVKLAKRARERAGG
ncbi:DUF2470 domain-containing protein [Thalassobaculum sp.]|uniref:HugZ family pyridoxamine 5'-phosphate oxidase n=1 Tax=Thalassobaculum sp. TaxID=2022740 RepID=UPI0032EF3FF4